MNQTTDTEGVIKFQLDFHAGAPLPRETCRELDVWRTILYQLGLTGIDPGRYGGLAYGNVSQRVHPRSFIISGSQTGGIPCLDHHRYCRVTDWNLEQGWLAACGPVQPSSESLTHAALYEANPGIQSVLHVHSPDIWQHASRLGLPATAPGIAYGTQDMALAAAGLIDSCQPRVIVMAGHRDGVLATGTAVEAVAQELIRTLVAAVLLN